MDTKLLRQYLHLLTETIDDNNHEAPFALMGNVEPIKSPVKSKHEFVIPREFPLKVTQDYKNALGLSDEDAPNDIFDTLHDVTIDVDVYHQESSFSGNMIQPPDFDEFEISDWRPIAINSIAIDENDQQRLREYLGELTEEELKLIESEWFKRLEDDFDPGPEFDR